jgi:hypothetical protein
MDGDESMEVVVRIRTDAVIMVWLLVVVAEIKHTENNNGVVRRMNGNIERSGARISGSSNRD